MKYTLLCLFLVTLRAHSVLTPAGAETPPLAWSQQVRLAAAERQPGAHMGVSVAISADGMSAVAGAYKHGNPEANCDGAVFVFTRSAGAWVQQAKLIAKAAGQTSFFGIGVSISADGNRVAVGAEMADVGNRVDQGAAYVFTRTNGTWSAAAPVFGVGSKANDRFGGSVSLSGDGNTLAVGARNAGLTAAEQGTVTVFAWNGSAWALQSTLSAGDPSPQDLFGMTLSLSSNGDTLVVGAGYDDVGNNANQGSAYVFERVGRTWTQRAHLVATSTAGHADQAGAASDYFGDVVAVSGDGKTILIGSAHHEDVNGVVDRGAVYVFQRTAESWSQRGYLLAADGRKGDFFGSGIALSVDGKTAIVGAEDADHTAPDQGAAYVFELQADVWTQRAKLLAPSGAAQDIFGHSVSINSDGTTALVGAYGDDVAETVDQGWVYVFQK